MKIQEQKIEFQIQAIELLDIDLIYPTKPLNNPMTFHFSLNIEHKVNTEKSIVIVVAHISVFNEDTVTKLGSLKTSCIFRIANFNDFFNQKTKQVHFSDSIITTLNSITISTSRGIMFSQFKGTFLHNAILPIIDPKNFTASN